jgi:DNA-binding NtrC family response regulator
VIGPLWIIDEEQWTRACLRAELLERGHDVIGFERMADALLALWRGDPVPAVVLIDVAGQHLDQRTLLAFRGRGSRLVGLVGGLQRQSELARSSAWDLVRARPVRLGDLADDIERLLVSPQQPQA